MLMLLPGPAAFPYGSRIRGLMHGLVRGAGWASGAVWHFSSFQATRCDVLDDVLDDVRIRITNKSIRC